MIDHGLDSYLAITDHSSLKRVVYPGLIISLHIAHSGAAGTPPQRAPPPFAVDLIEYSHHLLGGGRLGGGEHVVGELAALTQIEQHDFGVAVSEHAANRRWRPW